MKALVYRGSRKRHFENRPRPMIGAPTDAIVKVATATVSGLNLHVMRDGAPRIAHGRILGHEGTGIVTEVGGRVTNFCVGDCVLISSLTSCGSCAPCRAGEPAQCENGGWLLGNSIDGTYAEFVRVPFADHSLIPLTGADAERASGPQSDNFPGGLIRDVVHDWDGDATPHSVVLGGPVGIEPVLAVMQYYREVIRPGLPASRSHPHGAREHHHPHNPASAPFARRSTRRSLTRHPLQYFAPAKKE